MNPVHTLYNTYTYFTCNTGKINLLSETVLCDWWVDCIGNMNEWESENSHVPSAKAE